MLQNPIDYMPNVIDPFTAGLAGFEMGQQGRAQEQAITGEAQRQDVFGQQAVQEQAMNAQKMRLNDQNMAQSSTLFDQQQADRSAQQEAAKAFVADQVSLAGKVEDGTVTAGDFTSFTVKYPEFANEMTASFEGLSTERKRKDAFELAKIATAIKTGNTDAALKLLEDRAVAAENGGQAEDAAMARALAAQIGVSPAAGLTMTGLAMQQMDPDAFKAVFGDDESTPADVRSLQWRANAAGLKEGSEEYKKFIASNGGKSEDAPASFRALQMQAQAAGLVEGTPEYKEFMATKGAGLVAQASAEGKAEGENVSLLSSMESKMPGLELVVADLETLADNATYTEAGQLYDATRKQFGMEPRSEAVARAEYIAMVDNQVLPLLRDTFGAAFTQKEGDTLRATLGDPDKSPAEKKAVLRAFIAQKKRDVAALQSQVGAKPTVAPPTALLEKAGVTVDEWNALSPDEQAEFMQ